MKLERTREPLWAQIVNGQYAVEVQHIDTDEYVLAIFDDESGVLMHSEPTTVMREPVFGAHVLDVVRWQERAAELIDAEEPPWNQTS